MVCQMRLPKKTLATAALVFSVANAVQAGKWLDDQNWSGRGALDDSVIVSRMHESPVVGRFGSTGETFDAQAIAVALPISSDAVLREVQTKAQKRFKDAHLAIYNDATLVSAWTTSTLASDAVITFERRDWSSRLTSLGIDINAAFLGYRLRSKPYNRVPERQGYSTLTVLLLDGTGLMSEKCTLLVLYRTDRAKQWGLLSIHDPFSFRYSERVIDVVTTGEYGIVQQIAESIPGSSKILKLSDASGWYEDYEVWSLFRNTCKTR